MVNDKLFGPMGQIIIYGIISIVVIIAILVIACFVTPGCIGYECVRPRKKSKRAPTLNKNKAIDDVKNNYTSYRSWRLGSLYDTNNGTIHEHSISPRDSINSVNSQFESIDTSSVVNLVNPSGGKKGKEKPFPTELTLSLRFLPYCEGVTSSKLVIGIEAVSGLPPKQYNCTLDPYVKLNITKQSWTHKKKREMYSFTTKSVKQTANPIFKESFVISGISTQEIKEWILNFEVHDHDRYANHTKLCELQVLLKDMKKIYFSPETHLFNFHMKQSKEEYGSILLGMSYLPTAQRLTINVMKLRNVKFMPTIPNIHEFNPYVRILMLNGKTGRRMKKKKTKCITGIQNIEFNETLTFDLPIHQIDSIQFLVILCSKLTQEDKSSAMMNEVPSDSEDSISSFQKPKDICLGKVAFGKGVRGVTERLHWFSTLQNPRKLVTVWHSLK
ncbi:synaptotagmin-2-like [Phymastichus coffea]|uniref:synaptotagmin-2-like n=1 Tax=Phymastichus coffea TaxID=108790 RepID=UPI00273B2492|nr:synaptotagmin-2-like [Phymastichus coffea]